MKFIHGLHYDLGVMLLSFALPALAFSQVYDATRPIPGVPAFTPRPELALLFLASAFAQIAGSLLKAPALRSRMNAAQGAFRWEAFKSWKLDLLLLFHFCVLFFLLAIATAAPGASEWLDSLNLSTLSKALILGSTALPTIATAWAIAGPSMKLQPRSASIFEHAGNLFLIFSAVVLQAWVHRAIGGMSLEARSDLRTLGPGAIIGHFAVVFPLFTIFYLPPRILFLVEDHNRWRTWLQILGVNLILMLRVYLSK